MIFISVQSEIQETKRQFETHRAAEQYLKKVKELHDMARARRLPPRPPETATKALLAWQKDSKQCIPLRIDILDTDAAQLSLTPILIQTSK